MRPTRSGTPTPTPINPTRRYKEEAQAQRKEIYKLEKEREKYGAEASEATSKYLQAQTLSTVYCSLADRSHPPASAAQRSAVEHPMEYP